MNGYQAKLLAGISVLGFAAAQPGAATAADLGRPQAMISSAPAPAGSDAWKFWLEGGPAALEGDPGVAGMNNPPFDVDPDHWGWEAAAGGDYQFAGNPWIWSWQFRYGRNGRNSESNSPVGLFLGTGGQVSVVGSNFAGRNEHHWLADFMVGRDLGLGMGVGDQVGKFGVRVAEIRGRTKGTAEWYNVPVFPTIDCSTAPSYCGSEIRDYTQENKFVGVGPRVELDGNIPLGGHWSIEYMGGAAALYGRRKANQNVTLSNPTVSTFTGPASLLAGGPIDASSSGNDWVFNLDAMAGLTYAFNPTARMIFSYRFDGYWDALRGYNSDGEPADLDRFYHGPMVRFVLTNGVEPSP